MPSNNLAILSCAGSGKTTEIVRMAGAANGRSLLLTYTRNNTEEIRRRFYEVHGFIPPNCDVSTWYSFLLSHFVRPYQRQLRTKRIAQINWNDGKSVVGTPKANVARYYFSPQGRIYRDKVSEFGTACDVSSGGLVVARLSQIYSTIYIDEFQDLAGWDLEIVELLLRSQIRTVIVGDHRQHTFRTNDSSKNKQYLGAGILRLIEKWKKGGLCETEPRNQNRRGCQAVCDFADHIFPHVDRMVSVGVAATGHDGIFTIGRANAAAYHARFSPAVLRWDKKTACDGYHALNFGESKGLAFDRVLIYPNGPVAKFLKKNDPASIANAQARLYVGVTRARFSVAFVFDGTCAVPGVVPHQPL